MSHYVPTHHLRFVEREVPDSPTTAHRVKVLQQGWAPSYGGHIEWRDVPLVQEASPARKEAFDHDAFTDALLRAMDARGVTQKQVAESTGVSETTLSRMRTGRHPDAASLAALSAWAGINPARFMKAADPIPSQEVQP